MQSVSPADIVRSQLAPYLGAFTSRNAVQVVARRTLGRDPEQIQLTQVPELLEGLAPALRTLLGRENTDKVLGQIRKDLRLE